MKVLHVIDAMGLGGGAEHSLAAMLPLLRERGVESHLVTLIDRPTGLQQRLPEQGFEVTVLPQGSWPSRLAALRRHVGQVNPDLVHATLVNATLASRMAMIRGRAPLLNSIVNTTYDPVRIDAMHIPAWKVRVLRSIDGWTARHLADHLHALTEAVADEARDMLRIPSDRLTVIPRGRDEELVGRSSDERRRRTRESLKIGNDVRLIVNVGRQDHQKGQTDLVRAFGVTAAAMPDALLLIAGRAGSATPMIERTIAEEGLEGRVRLLGHRDDVLDLVAAADLFAFPSLYEGLGCSLVEAMALETPIVGSDAAAVAEVLEHGTLGVVTRRGDVAELGEALTALLRDQPRRRALAARGRARYLDQYELGAVADATVDVYRRVIENGRRPWRTHRRRALNRR